MSAPDPASFEFVSEGGAWSGTPVVNGHKVLTCEHIDVSIGYDSFPRVTLRLLAVDTLKVVLGEARASVADETREALISLGWTAPDGSGAAESLEKVREFARAQVRVARDQPLPASRTLDEWANCSAALLRILGEEPYEVPF